MLCEIGYGGRVPKVVDHAERRASIVAAAQRTIGAGGLEGATMRRIAGAASCTTGLLSHYFGSRDEILIAALRAAHRAAGQRMAAAALAAAADPSAALRRVLLEALPLDDRRRHEWLVWMAFWSRVPYAESLHAEHVSRYREWRSLLIGLVENVAPHRGTPLDADEEAFALCALIDGLGLQLTLFGGDGDAVRAVRAVDRHLEALGVDPSGGPGR
jgi:AcrR family transcriptional regulator